MCPIRHLLTRDCCLCFQPAGKPIKANRKHHYPECQLCRMLLCCVQMTVSCVVKWLRCQAQLLALLSARGWVGAYGRMTSPKCAFECCAQLAGETPYRPQRQVQLQWEENSLKSTLSSPPALWRASKGVRKQQRPATSPHTHRQQQHLCVKSPYPAAKTEAHLLVHFCTRPHSRTI